MTLAGLQSLLYDQLGYIQAPDAAVVRRLLGHMNQTQREILGMKGLTRLRRGLVTFDSVASSPFAVLPQAAVKILTITDRTNQLLLQPLSLSDLRADDPGLATSSSTPYGYLIDNLSASVAVQPSNASELFTKSTSASDDSTKEIFVEGFITGGYSRLASVAMNGVTAVSLGATITTWITVTKFYVALAAGGLTTAAGVITLHEDSGAGTELSRIGIGKRYPRYTRLQLYPTPTAALTYHADVELHIEDLVEATDEPYLPEDFHWLLNSGALIKEYTRKREYAALGQEAAIFRRGVADLKAFCNPQTTSKHARHSQLGSYYEDGT